MPYLSAAVCTAASDVNTQLAKPSSQYCLCIHSLQQPDLMLSAQADKPKSDDAKAAKANKAPVASSTSTSAAASASNGPTKSAAEPAELSSSAAQTLPPVEPSAAVADGTKPKDAAKKVSASSKQHL